MNVYGRGKDKVAFFDPEKKKVFLSPEEDEYPGDQYEELTKQEKAGDAASDGSSSDEAGDGANDKDKNEEKPGDKPKGGVE